METKLPIATLLLRLGLGATLLSAVADRFGVLWTDEVASWGNWNSFLEYAAKVNSFAPEWMIPFLAVSATVFEFAFGILLIIGYKTNFAALGTALLTFVFALSMAYSFGIKSPLDYSVFIDCTAAFLLSCIPIYRWSLDEFLSKPSIQ